MLWRWRCRGEKKENKKKCDCRSGKLRENCAWIINGASCALPVSRHRHRTAPQVEAICLQTSTTRRRARLLFCNLRKLFILRLLCWVHWARWKMLPCDEFFTRFDALRVDVIFSKFSRARINIYAKTSSRCCQRFEWRLNASHSGTISRGVEEHEEKCRII